MHFYTDGSCKPKNPGKGELAVIEDISEDENTNIKIIIQEGYFETTNQRMELRAGLKALKYIKEISKRTKINEVVITTDSKYVYGNQGNVLYWRANDWIKADEEIVMNKNLWKKYISIRTSLRTPITFIWEKGKTNEILDKVDKLAKAAAKIPTKKDIGYIPPKIADLLIKNKNVSSPIYDLENKAVIIRIFKHALEKNRGAEEYKIFFELFISQRYIGKYYAYAGMQDKMGIHRKHFYEVKFIYHKTHPRFKEFQDIGTKYETKE